VYVKQATPTVSVQHSTQSSSSQVQVPGQVQVVQQQVVQQGQVKGGGVGVGGDHQDKKDVDKGAESH